MYVTGLSLSGKPIDLAPTDICRKLGNVVIVVVLSTLGILAVTIALYAAVFIPYMREILDPLVPSAYYSGAPT